MWITQHPSADELRAYVSNGLRPPKSVRLARHLLDCTQCVAVASKLEEQLVLPTSPVISEPVFGGIARAIQDQWLQPSAGLATGAVAVILLAGLGNSLRPHGASIEGLQTPGPRLIVAAAPPVPPALPEADDSPTMGVARRAHASKRVRRPSRPFVAPDANNRAVEVGVLLPPPTPIPSSQYLQTVRFARLQTEVGPEPYFPAQQRKRHPLVRFLGALAKPFRADRT